MPFMSSPAVRRSLAGCSLAALLVGCASPPDLGPRPTLAAPQSYQSARSFVSSPAAWPADRWWESYGDAQLSALIDEALAHSPTLAIAAARVAQAQAQAQQAGAARLPSLGVQSATTASRLHLSADDVPEAIESALPNDWSVRSNVALSLNYQLDFFGRNRAAFAAATSQSKAAETEAADARLQLSTAVALAYAEFTRLCAGRDALRAAASMRQASLTLVRQRFDAGLENDGQLAQASAEWASARADLAGAEGAILRVRHQLAALMGAGPDRGLDIAEPVHAALGVRGLPADAGLNLIGRRPDLVAARLRAEAAGHRIDVAHANFYPNVNLAALVGVQTLGLDRLGGGTLSFGQVGPAVSLPIFSGGALEGAYRGARADYAEAVASYNQTLTTALRDVADALSDRRALDEELTQQRDALASARTAYRIARLRYEGGLISYIDTLSIESRLIAQERTVADLEARAFALDVTLVRALGGGFTTA